MRCWWTACTPCWWPAISPWPRATATRWLAVPPTARRLQMQALMAWMAGDFPAAETLAEQAWEHAEDLEPLDATGSPGCSRRCS